MDFQTEVGGWAGAQSAGTAIRRAVFQHEQGIAAELDHDGRDPYCLHVVARLDGQPAGVARLDGTHIQRVAVLPEFRGRGAGQLLIETLVETATRQGCTEVVADAQMTSVPIFRRLGFDVSDEETIIVGIAHRHVQLTLPAST
jgi:predicted GNAT family N-acyltransferase